MARPEAGVHNHLSEVPAPEASHPDPQVLPFALLLETVQCVNCSRKGRTAQECRQPKVDKSQRKCFLCDKPGHLARDCKERKAPIQAVQQQTREAAFLGCVQTVDKDDFVAVRRGVRQQEANLGDFIRSATDRKSLAVRSNRFRGLTVDDLNALSTPRPQVEVVASSS